MDLKNILIIPLFVFFGMYNASEESNYATGNLSTEEPAFVFTEDDKIFDNDSTFDKLPYHFYRIYTGVFESNKIIVYLYSKKREIAGYYVDESNQKRTNLTQTYLADDFESFTLQLHEGRYPESNETNEWQVKIMKDRLLVSCFGENGSLVHFDLNENYPEGSTRFKYVYEEIKIPLFEDKNDSPAYDIEYFIPMAENTNRARQVTYEIYKNLYFKTNIPLAQNIADAIQKETGEYKTAFKDYDEDAIPHVANWFSDTNVFIEYNKDDIVVLNHYVEQYFGGAHGLYGSKFTVIDMKIGKKLNLDDIIISAVGSKQEELLEKIFREKYGLNPEETLDKFLFENELHMSNNFFITETGLNFVYNVYEIAPYAVGMIELEIPWKNLVSILNPVFVERMGWE